MVRLVPALLFTCVTAWRPSSEITLPENFDNTGDGITAGFCYVEGVPAGATCHYASSTILEECAKGDTALGGSGTLHSCDPNTCEGRGEPWCAWSNQCEKYGTFASDNSGTLNVDGVTYSYTDSTHQLMKAFGHDFTTIDKSLCGGCVAVRTTRQDGKHNVVIAINADNVGSSVVGTDPPGQLSPEADMVMDHLGADVMMPVEGGQPRPWERGDRIPFEWMLVDCISLAEVSQPIDSWPSHTDTTTTATATSTTSHTNPTTTTTDGIITSTSTTSTMLASTTAALSTTVVTTTGGSICAGEPCASQTHCRSKWGFCGVTVHHCNVESLWCGSDTTGCQCGDELTTTAVGTSTTATQSGDDTTTTDAATTTTDAVTTTAAILSTTTVTTTGAFTTSILTTTAGDSCTGNPCASPLHCRSKWGWCGVTTNHCNSESLWCGAEAVGCQCVGNHGRRLRGWRFE